MNLSKNFILNTNERTMIKRIPHTILSLLMAAGLVAFGSPVFGQEVEVDPGIFVRLSERAIGPQEQLTHLTGHNIALDLTHDTGRQSLVTTS